MTKPLLLVQPLKIDDIKINIVDDDDNDEDQVQEVKPQETTVEPIDNIIDDAELLAILGFPTWTTAPNKPTINTNSLLDWEDMPELSESEEDENYSICNNNNKRKHDEQQQQDIFAQFDFEEVNLLYPPPTTKKAKIEEQDCLIDPQVGDLIST